ncbi:hypothetical protein [Kitasatospora sp. P5_F3]
MPFTPVEATFTTPGSSVGRLRQSVPTGRGSGNAATAVQWWRG